MRQFQPCSLPCAGSGEEGRSVQQNENQALMPVFPKMGTGALFLHPELGQVLLQSPAGRWSQGLPGVNPPRVHGPCLTPDSAMPPSSVALCGGQATRKACPLRGRRTEWPLGHLMVCEGSSLRLSGVLTMQVGV